MRVEAPWPGKTQRMESSKVLLQIDSLIDDLLNEGDVSSSSLASMMMAMRDSVRGGYHVAMARRKRQPPSRVPRS